MRNRRAIFLCALSALSLSGALTACGGEDGVDKAKIESDINAGNASAATFPDAANGTAAKEQQENADAAAREAERALERRERLAKLEQTQKEETERILNEGVAGGNDEDMEIPIGSADPEAEEFRARLAGVCAGGQKRILKVSDQAKDAQKSKDPMKILAAAQAYQLALDDFLSALGGLNAPPSVRDDYRAWLGTINALAANIRLQLVSSADPKKAERLGRKTERLTQRLLEQSATLGVTCLSATI